MPESTRKSNVSVVAKGPRSTCKNKLQSLKPYAGMTGFTLSSNNAIAFH